MAHLHTDMERFDVHVALEVCEIVIIVAILESGSERFADFGFVDRAVFYSARKASVD